MKAEEGVVSRGFALVFTVALTALCGCGGGELGVPDGGADRSSPDGDIVAACETPIPVQSVSGSPCRFPIPAPPCDAVDRAHIRVLVGGTEIFQDPNHVDGWDYGDANQQTVDIYGPRCDAITAGAVTNVSIQFYIYGFPAPALSGAAGPV